MGLCLFHFMRHFVYRDNAAVMHGARSAANTKRSTERDILSVERFKQLAIRLLRPYLVFIRQI